MSTMVFRYITAILGLPMLFLGSALSMEKETSQDKANIVYVSENKFELYKERWPFAIPISIINEQAYQELIETTFS